MSTTVHLDLGIQRAYLVNAGHPPPLLRDSDLGTHVLHVPPGLLLGISPDVTYPITEIDLRPGALLALYTDGLVEVPGTDLDESTADLARCLAAGEGSLDRISQTLLHHARPPRARPTTSPSSCSRSPEREPSDPREGPHRNINPLLRTVILAGPDTRGAGAGPWSSLMVSLAIS